VNGVINTQPRRIEWLAWGGLALIILTLLLAFILAQLKLRVFLGKPLPVISQVAGFSLTNQDRRPVSLADWRGHVVVADIIFTRCPGPCLQMTRRMHDLQQALPTASQARLVSLTTDPDFDTPAVLRSYAQLHGAGPSRWMFLTGTKKEIARLAIDSLKLTVIEKKPEERESPQDLFVHSTIFVVVDKRARLRGVFETTGEDVAPQKVKVQILAAVRRLEREP
jgi:protein SCO1/2